MTSTAATPTHETALLSAIAERAFVQMVAMIHQANHRSTARPGDPKVGGHPAACASSLHILGALHLHAREPQDYVCCKPHAAPMDHAYHNLLGLFRHQDGTWFTDAESEAVMSTLRKFPEPLPKDGQRGEEVFQSYHARSDADSFHFLPSGTVGIPPVASAYLALAHRYARDHQMNVPPKAHFWSLIGDSEFREGSLLECMPDVSERLLGNVTWIIDFNRQNLDGTRIANEKALHSRDADRIESTARANGWRVIQVRHGAFREEVFRRPGGEALRHLFESGLSDNELQHLLFNRKPDEVRRVFVQTVPSVKELVGTLTDEDLLRLLTDLGGHDMAVLTAALSAAREDPDVPYLVVVHTIKGWKLSSFADPSNHSSLPSEKEVAALLEERGLSLERPFEHFAQDSEEGAYLMARATAFRAGMEEITALSVENRRAAKQKVLDAGGLPDALDIDLSLFPMVHTQWMWGQLAAKLVRIGTSDEAGHPEMAGGAKPLTPDEERWKTAADLVLTMSPDVGTSTNIAPAMDQRIYGPNQTAVAEEIPIDVRHPKLATTQDPWTRHIRFEIAEANCMSAAGAFGKMGHYTGLPFLPMMTVYDFFIKRALDQLYYNLYWGSEFVLIGTPSGITLAPEGAQHSWKSDIQIPNLITWEPLFALEMDWILSDALKRHMEDDNDGRRGVLIRGVTRAIPQALLLANLRRHAAHKAGLPSGATLKPKGAGDEWGAALDESGVPAQDDSKLLADLRRDVLAGAYYLVDWRGYEGYEPGENVVHVFAMGSVATEALTAAEQLVERGIFANLIVISSPELLLGILGDHDDYRHLREGLGVTGDLHAVAGAGESEAGLVSLAGRRVPIVALCDGEAGLVDNIGSIVGVKQRTLAVRKFSKCGRPDQVFAYQGIDPEGVAEVCGQVLAETALEDFVVSPALIERLAGRAPAARRDWRELWPDAPSAP